MKKTIAIVAVIICSAILWALPAGKQHNGISVVAGVVTYQDGSKDKSIIASFKTKDGRFLIKEISFSKNVNAKLLSETLLNQDGFTEKQIKEYGYAIDHKRRKVIMQGNIATFQGSYSDPVKWEFSQKLTDAVTFFAPEKIKEKEVFAKAEAKKKEKTIKEKTETLLEKLQANKNLRNWAENQ
jgi:hypothetical protein